MGFITDIIKYNVKERFRKFRGQERNFDTVALANMINGGEIQERVKHGDLLGFYGHWPRIKFGMNPQEGGFVDGKQVALEPAIRTVYLKGHPNGDIEHKVEFLETAAGKLAERMFKSKAGGFSSAIDFQRNGDKQRPIGFYGFDFVFEPNFSGNRGYALALDSVDGVISEFDAVDEYNGMVQTMNAAFDEQEAERARLEQTIADLQKALDSTLETNRRIEEENVALLSEITRKGLNPEPAMDGVQDLIRTDAPIAFDNADSFLQSELAGYENSSEKKKEDDNSEVKRPVLDRVLERLTW